MTDEQPQPIKNVDTITITLPDAGHALDAMRYVIYRGNFEIIASICRHTWATDLGLNAIDPNYKGPYEAHEYCKHCGERK